MLVARLFCSGFYHQKDLVYLSSVSSHKPLPCSSNSANSRILVKRTDENLSAGHCYIWHIIGYRHHFSLHQAKLMIRIARNHRLKRRKGVTIIILRLSNYTNISSTRHILQRLRANQHLCIGSTDDTLRTRNLWEKANTQWSLSFRSSDYHASVPRFLNLPRRWIMQNNPIPFICALATKSAYICMRRKWPGSN